LIEHFLGVTMMTKVLFLALTLLASASGPSGQSADFINLCTVKTLFEIDKS